MAHLLYVHAWQRDTSNCYEIINKQSCIVGQATSPFFTAGYTDNDASGNNMNLIEGIWWRQSLYTSRPWGIKLYKIATQSVFENR